MSIATAIQAAQQKIANAYAAISNKGGTLPATQDLSNMPTAINSIQTGITPTGTKYITTNGTHNVTNYEYADVNVSGGGSSKYFGCGGDTFIGEIDANGTLQAAYESQYIDNIVFTGVTDIGQAGLSGKFWNDTTTSGANTRPRARLVTNIAFPDLINITGSYALYYFCYRQNMLQSVAFPELKTINASNAMSYAFYSCKSLTSVSFPKLETVSGSNAVSNLFSACTYLAHLYFGSLTGNISSSNTLSNVTGCTVHLPTGYTGTCNLGGTNTVYLYDL